MPEDCEFLRKWSQITSKQATRSGSCIVQQSNAQNVLQQPTATEHQNQTNTRNQEEKYYFNAKYILILPALAVFFYAWSIIKDLLGVVAICSLVIFILRSA